MGTHILPQNKFELRLVVPDKTGHLLHYGGATAPLNSSKICDVAPVFLFTAHIQGSNCLGLCKTNQAVAICIKSPVAQVF